MDEKHDVYWGRRVNNVQQEPIIKGGMRVRFRTPGRVQGKNVYGIRLDEPGQIECYDPQQIIEFSHINPVTLGDSDFQLQAKATSNLPIYFVSSDPSVVEIYKGNRAKIKKVGQAVVTAVQEGNYSWLKATASQTISVEPAK